MQTLHSTHEKSVYDFLAMWKMKKNFHHTTTQQFTIPTLDRLAENGKWNLFLNDEVSEDCGEVDILTDRSSSSSSSSSSNSFRSPKAALTTFRLSLFLSKSLLVLFSGGGASCGKRPFWSFSPTTIHVLESTSSNSIVQQNWVVVNDYFVCILFYYDEQRSLSR